MFDLNAFWTSELENVQKNAVDANYKLPLARIKKVMKSDDQVKSMMISAEAPIVFSKACELFIRELTQRYHFLTRSWDVTEANKRRTLQNSDIVEAISKSDQYDFLIDIAPRPANSFFFPTSQVFVFNLVCRSVDCRAAVGISANSKPKFFFIVSAATGYARNA